MSVWNRGKPGMTVRKPSPYQKFLKGYEPSRRMYHKLTILQKTDSEPSATGVVTSTWTDLVTVNCSATSMSSKEVDIEGREIDIHHIHFMIRYRSDINLKDYRIRYDGTEYNIVSVINVEGRSEYTELVGREIP